ncbi:MAG: hypothetical protein AAB618_01225 [Patescibacteria group bacterium]
MKKNNLAVLLFLLCFLIISSDDAKAATTPTAVSQTESEKRVREFFKDTPVMIEIARCESAFRQFTDAGNVLRGGDSGGMVGVFQFFESIHAAPAKALGYDITTLEGNLGYAKQMYKSEGTTPWNPAKSCWNVKPAAVKSPATRAELEAKIKQLMQLIKLLKQLQELRAK